MTAAVNVTKPEKKDYLVTAREAWKDALPDWVETLAVEATRTSAAAVAGRLGYSGAVLSGLFRAKYTGALGAVEQKARGAYMGAVVDCPVMGETARDVCLDEQKKTFKGTSSMRTQLFHACRRGCEHSRLQKESANV